MNLRDSSNSDGPAGFALITAKLQHAVELHQQGRLAQAQAAYIGIIAEEPRNRDALYLLAVIASQSERSREALHWIGKALEIDPQNPVFNFTRACALHDLRQLPEALACYDAAVAISPDFAECHSNRAMVLKDLGRLDAALVSCDRAIAGRWDFAEAHFNRGVVLEALHRLDEALASYERTIDIRGDYPEAHFNRGNILRGLKRHDAALASYEQAILYRPGYVAAHVNLGGVLCDLRRWEEALASYDRALSINPNDAPTLCNRSKVLNDLQRHEEALASCDRAIAADRNCAEAHVNRGVILKELKRWEEALQSYDRAIQINADFAQAHGNRGDLLRELRQWETAIISLGKASALDPHLKGVLGSLHHSKLQICDWSGWDADAVSFADRIDRQEVAENPFCVMALCGSAALQLKAAQTWVRSEVRAAPAPRAFPSRTAGGRIRVGYFSADFRIHPVSSLAAQLMESHDRGRFELTAFSLGPDTKDPLRRRLERAFERFVDVRDRSDSDIVRLARDAELDIAVDLNGFTQGCRPGIFAMRAAPVQVSFLGFPGTMGAKFIDYIIADRVVVPESLQSHFAEKIIFLPGSYMPCDATRVISNRQFTRKEFGLPDFGFVLCCFNNHFKITPPVFDSWMRILGTVEGSVLWLGEGNPAVTRNLRMRAQERGINPNRLVFAKHMQSYADHLARHRVADLFVDTLPFSAHSTANDALWAGLPVLTRAGESFCGRVAASLLSAVGLPELIVDSQERYEELAIELGTNSQRLARISRRLGEARLASPLFNSQLYARNIEAAYAAIMERHLANLPAEHIHVDLP